jgi:3-hydroxy-9,10-secoandrosta-1,3,5(10)-triene-9,17-dione monooxygenase
MSLGAGHAMHLASYFSEQAQIEAFGPDGHFVCPQRALPGGKAVPVEGGYRISGSWGYASGVVHANWFMAAAFVAPDANGAAPPPIAFVVPLDLVKVLDDWRADAFSLEATGSNTVVIEDVFVPAHMTDRFDWPTRSLGDEGTPGYRLHGNPLYLGRPLTYFICELGSSIVGAAWAALDEYEALMRGKQTSFPPLMQRAQSPFYQQWYGEAMGRVESAQALLLAAARQYTDYGRAWAEKRTPFEVAEDTRTRQIGLQAARLACSAVDLMFTTAGTSSVKLNSRLARIFRDVSMFRTHVTAQWDVLSQSAGLVAMGGSLTI